MAKEKRNPNIPKCDECQMLAINGVNCHETGCPNSKKTWMADRQEWVRFFECFECGCEVEEGEVCGCDVDETHRDDGEDRDGNPLCTCGHPDNEHILTQGPAPNLLGECGHVDPCCYCKRFIPMVAVSE